MAPPSGQRYEGTMRVLIALLFASIWVGPVQASVKCEWITAPESRYLVCNADVETSRLIMAHSDQSGKAYGGLRPFLNARQQAGQTVPFAMNGGMYHDDLSPVGYYVEGRERLKNANTRPGPGNFHMLPNGIFWVDGNRAGVTETKSFLTVNKRPDYATQSGPMLLIDGKVHPRFKPDSSSRKVRNGVGVSNGGRTAIFALSERRVTFWEFATLFRDRLGTDNALYLDGTISSVHAPELGRSDRLFPVGPIIAVVE